MASSMAMRRAAAAATTTTPFTLFTKLIKSKPAAATRCSFSTTAKSPPSAASNDDDDSGPVTVKGPPRKFKMENPFQLGGPANVIEVDEAKVVGTLVRVALPGVGPEDIKVWAENNTVFFAGKGEIELEGEEESRRKYGGSLEFRPELNRVDGFKAEMVNGILRLVVPNADKQG